MVNQMDLNSTGVDNPAFVMSREDVPERQIIVSAETDDNLVQSGVAIQVRNAFLQYGSDDSGEFFGVQDVDLTLRKGEIYALLGPSGCGKTTLLCSLIGLRRLQRGSVHIFGKKPGATGSGVPGPWIGLMPQDLSLYSVLTIEETLSFFGRLQGMSNEQLRTRIDFLVKLLELPSTKVPRLVNQLSGGQQRRLSLAASLIHSPPLVLLDEPTVGVDPLLRKHIWTHLIRMTREQGITVLITTHYIEEARKADKVGLMRGGHLLSQGNPEHLISVYGSQTLEEVFLKVCTIDNREKHLVKRKRRSTDEVVTSPENYLHQAKTDDTTSSLLRIQTEQKESFGHHRESTNRLPDIQLPSINSPFKDFLTKSRTLTRKNLILLKRNLIFLIVAFATPGMNVVLGRYLMGHNPFGLEMSVYNGDSNSTSLIGSAGQKFLDHIDNKTLIVTRTTDPESALNLVRDGSAWASLIIPSNFTHSLLRRMRQGLTVDNETLHGSRIGLSLSSTSLEVGRTLYFSVLESYDNFARAQLETIGADPRLATTPLTMEEPVYGHRKPAYSDIMVASMLPDNMLLMGICLSAVTLVTERSYGLLDRSRVAGVTPLQILSAHLVIQILLSAGQITVLVTFLHWFTTEIKGQPALLVTLSFLQGTVGMALGVLISSLVKTTYNALVLTTGVYISNFFLSGLLWPIEGQATWVRTISKFSFEAQTLEAVKAVIFKGWGISHPVVWSSIVICIVWTVLPLLAAFVIFKIKH